MISGKESGYCRLLLVGLCIACAGSGSIAEEPASKFLQELRERGYYDLATEYLDRLASHPNIPADIQQSIQYEQGVTLVEAVLVERDPRIKEQKLTQAQIRFASFIQDHPSHPLVLKAITRQGRILLERARIRQLRAEMSNLSADAKKKLIAEAVQFFDQAEILFQKNEVELKAKLAQYPKALVQETEPDLFQERQQFRLDYVRGKFQTALVKYERAALLDDKSQREKTLNDAFAGFSEVADKYRKFTRGIESIFYQGLCKQDLGDPKEALSFYVELIEWPNAERDPDIRLIKTKALKQSIECWLHPAVNNADAAIQNGEAWLKVERPTDKRYSDWNGFKLAVGKAYLANSKTLKGPDRQKQMRAGRRLVNAVAKSNTSFQKQAQDLLLSLGSVDNVEEKELPQPKSFAEAVEAAKDVRDRHKIAFATIRIGEKGLERNPDQQARDSLQQRIDEAHAQLAELQVQEIHFLRTALEMADKDVSQQQINDLRYWLCYFYYLNEDDYRASVLGEFMARHFPDALGSRQAVQYALASLARIYDQEDSDPLVGEKILALAELIVQRWPESEESAVALSALVKFSLRKKDFDAAEKHLANIPEQSPRRGNAELSFGQEIWTHYAEQRQSSEDPHNPELSEMKNRAIRFLSSGVARNRNAEVDTNLLYAIMNLAQIYLDEGKYDDAAELLDDPSNGPHAMVKNNNPLTQDAKVAQRCYQLAIQAYIGQMAQGADPEESLKKSNAGLSALRDVVSKAGGGESALITQYVGLASQLQKQLDKADEKSKESFAAGYIELLNRVADSTEDSNLQLWAAQSFGNLGKSLKPANGAPSGKGVELTKRAIALYEKVLAAQVLDKTKSNQVKLKIAMLYRDALEFANAAKSFENLLSWNENQVYIQIEAARNFQLWANHGNAEAYKNAIAGDRLMTAQNRNLVWGWAKLTKVLVRYPKLRHLFFDAHYNLVMCRYRWAITNKGDERKKLLQIAKNDVVFISRQYSSLGGEEQAAKYDGLMKQIQNALGQPQTGIGNQAGNN